MGLIGRIVKWLAVTVGVLVIVVAVAGVLIYRAIVLPDAETFGKKPDEALRARIIQDEELSEKLSKATLADLNDTSKRGVTLDLELDEATLVRLEAGLFPAAGDDYFADMDKGVLKKPDPGTGASGYDGRIKAVAKAAGLSPAKVEDLEFIRKAAIKGQNAWLVWSGGNDRFWDWAASNTAGAFDLLKLVSSHPSLYYGRDNRMRYLGLVNEPCFTKATGPDSKRFGLYLDQPDHGPDCKDDPFASEEKYPGIKIGARGTAITKDQKDETVEWPATVPVGSFYGDPTGVLGLRLFPNPNFDATAQRRWDPIKYYTDPDYYNDKNLVRPYRVGMSCAFCHVGPNPVNPPDKIENPRFAEINSNPGAQYFWVNRIFFWNTRPRGPGNQPSDNEGNLLYQLFNTNPPGALDTSLVSTDYMNNPRTMNAVYRVLARLKLSGHSVTKERNGKEEKTWKTWAKERLVGGERDNKQFQDYPQTAALADYWVPNPGNVSTMRVLKDGADAVGALGALNRVYLNIGLFSEEWLEHFRPFIGAQRISPIKIADAQKQSLYWRATENMTADMAIFFLVTASPDRLAAPDRQEDRARFNAYLDPFDSPKINRGKIVFAENCAACHSSDIPDDPPAESGVDQGLCKDGGNGPHYRECWDRYWAWAKTDDFKTKMRKKVLAKDRNGNETFLLGNYLSTERRIPVDLLKTNACAAIATNALRGDVWDNFSSDTYKKLPPVKPVTVHHPVSGGATPFQPLGNGRGYIRPPSLVSLWSSAPFLLNNSVGHPDYDAKAGYSGGKPSYSTGYDAQCPSGNPGEAYLPCLDNRMALFDDSIRKMLYPERRRRDRVLGDSVPGYIYRSSAPFCVKFPYGYLPDALQTWTGVLNWVAPWAVDEKGNLALGPLPRDFPMNTLLNTQLLPDNDQDNTLGHLWKLAKATPTLLGSFKDLGGMCSPEELRDPGVNARASNVLRDSGFVDTLVGLSKCPDYVVNRGHTFGASLSDQDKESLIAFLKHF